MSDVDPLWEIYADALNAASDAFSHEFNNGDSSIAMGAAIEAYEAALWQPVNDPLDVPREQWIVVYNELTNLAYTRFYQQDEEIGQNVTAWRPGIKPPKARSADDD